MPTRVGIRELLEAGVHFGHQTRRWNPKMRRFIHGERTGIYIIDLLKTEQALIKAQDFAGGIARRGGTILFVGTKKQARDSVEETAKRCGMPYIQHRWLGGVLTNYQTVSARIKRLHDLERYENEGQLALLPTQERMKAIADLAKLRNNLGGVKFMTKPPDAIFIVDLNTEEIAVREGQRLRIPIIGLVDTNCDPDGIQYVIPGNDDGIKSCSLILRAMGDVILENRSVWQEAEQARMRVEQEAAAARAAEEAARVAAQQEAEAQAAREAAERLEEKQAEYAATLKANQPVERGGDGQGRPHPAPTVAEDLSPRPGPGRGKKVKQAPSATQAEIDALSSGSVEPAKAATDMAHAAAPDTPAEADAPAAEAVAPAAPAETPAADAAIAANAEKAKPKRKAPAKKAEPVQVAGEAPSGESPPVEGAAGEATPATTEAAPEADAKPKRKPARKPKAKKEDADPAAKAPAEVATEPTTEK